MAAKFTDTQIAAAVKQAEQIPAKGNNPNKVAPFWDRPKKMPSIADVDFRDVTVKPVTLSTLFASNKSLKRDRLVWHCEHPGQARNPSVFTAHPLIMDTPDGQVIIDGHHRLAAMQLLGQKTWPSYLVPSK